MEGRRGKFLTSERMPEEWRRRVVVFSAVAATEVSHTVMLWEKRSQRIKYIHPTRPVAMGKWFDPLTPSLDQTLCKHTNTDLRSDSHHPREDVYSGLADTDTCSQCMMGSTGDTSSLPVGGDSGSWSCSWVSGFQRQWCLLVMLLLIQKFPGLCCFLLQSEEAFPADWFTKRIICWCFISSQWTTNNPPCVHPRV